MADGVKLCGTGRTLTAVSLGDTTLTVAGKINALVVSLAILAGGVFLIYSAAAAYNTQYTLTVSQAVAALRGNPQLQMAIYYRDEAALIQFLDTVLPEQPSAPVRTARRGAQR